MQSASSTSLSQNHHHTSKQREKVAFSVLPDQKSINPSPSTNSPKFVIKLSKISFKKLPILKEAECKRLISSFLRKLRSNPKLLLQQQKSLFLSIMESMEQKPKIKKFLLKNEELHSSFLDFTQFHASLNKSPEFQEILLESKHCQSLIVKSHKFTLIFEALKNHPQPVFHKSEFKEIN